VLSATNNSTANQGNSSTAESPARHPSGLSRGAKVGIGLGATVGSLGIAGAIVLVYFTNWKNKALQKNRNERDVQTKNLVHEKDATLYREVGQGASHEIPADNGIHEL